MTVLLLRNIAHTQYTDDISSNHISGMNIITTDSGEGVGIDVTKYVRASGAINVVLYRFAII